MARWTVVALALLGGCSNPCQQLCLEMADYAEECGLTVSADEVKSCRDAYANADQTETAQCQTWNDADQVREWWSCQDVEDNFQNGLK
jgi:hypothetical protein